MSETAGAALKGIAMLPHIVERPPLDIIHDCKTKEGLAVRRSLSLAHHHGRHKAYGGKEESMAVSESQDR